MIDVKKIRAQFPIYTHNPNLIYLDTTASSLKPKQVIDALSEYYSFYGVNVHRGSYQLSYDATALYEKAREIAANYINADVDEVIFTRGTTTSLNMIAYSYMDKLKAGDEIITSELEHHSSFLPWQQVAKKTGATLRFVELDKDGNIAVDAFKKALTKNTKVVALTYVSNVMGRVVPIKEIIKLAQEVGAVTIVDAAQATAHFKVDVKDLNCDFLAFSGHKMTGPSGVGVLFIKKGKLQDIGPIEYGGEMAEVVEKETMSYKGGPAKFEAGTPIISGAIGLGKAIEFLEDIGLDNIEKHIKKLYDYAYEKLSKIEGITIYNPNSDTGIITFNIDGVHAHDAATSFDQKGICVRAGKHCAHLILDWLKASSTLRVSFYIYNDKKDVDEFINAVIETRDFFNQF